MMKQYFFSFVRLSGVIVLAIALTSLAGHMTHHPLLYDWRGNQVGMGLNTSLAFILVGISLVILSLIRNGKKGHDAHQISS